MQCYFFYLFILKNQAIPGLHYLGVEFWLKCTVCMENCPCFLTLSYTAFKFHQAKMPFCRPVSCNHSLHVHCTHVSSSVHMGKTFCWKFCQLYTVCIAERWDFFYRLRSFQKKPSAIDSWLKLISLFCLRSFAKGCKK